MADESNPSNFTHAQNYHAPAADQYPQTKTVLDMYAMKTRTITITAAGQERIQSGPGAHNLFHE